MADKDEKKVKAGEYEPMAQMTFKKMGCDAKDAIRAGKNVFMCRVFGEAADIKVKEAKGGDTYSYLIGEFRAETAAGKLFESGKLFLPGSIMETVEAQLKTVEDGKGVQFAFDVFSQPDDDVTIGYKYAVRQLIKPESSDRLIEMGKQLATKALPKSEPIPNKPAA